MPARVVFAGTPEFAIPSLEALAHAGMAPLAVFTQPDRPAGRGRRLTPPPVKRAAEAQGLPVHQPEWLDGEQAAVMRELAPDILVVAAYGQILRRNILEVPRCGCVNVHASLLPRWRGAAPIQRALLAGDRQTGVTLMRMSEGLDTGPILAQARTPITADDTAGSLHDRLARLGGELLAEQLGAILRGEVEPRPQPEEGATYAAKLTREEGRLDPGRTAAELERRVRALAPVPGVRVALGGQDLRVLAAEACYGSESDVPGTVVSAGGEGVAIATRCGRLRITRVKPSGGREQSVADYLNGHHLPVGEVVH